MNNSEKKYRGNPIFSLMGNRNQGGNKLAITLRNASIIIVIIFITLTAIYSNYNGTNQDFAHLNFSDLILLGINLLFMFLLLIITTSHNSVLTQAKTELTFDQIIMTGLTPWQWLTGTFLAVFTDYLCIVIYFIPVLVGFYCIGVLSLTAVIMLPLAFLLFAVCTILWAMFFARGLMNLFSLLFFINCSLVVFTLGFIIFIKEKTFALLITQGSVYLTAFNPLALSFENMTQNHQLQVFTQATTATIQPLNIYTLFLISNIVYILMSTVYLLIGNDSRGESNLLIDWNMGMQIQIGFNIPKNERINNKLSHNLRIFQENNFPFIRRNEYLIRGLLDLITFATVIWLIAQLVLMPIKSFNSMRFTLVTCLIAIPALSCGLNFCKAVCGLYVPGRALYRERLADFIYPVGKVAVLIFVSFYLGKKIIAMNEVYDNVQFIYLPAIITMSIIVISSAGIFFSLINHKYPKALCLNIGFLALWLIIIPFLIFIGSNIISNLNLNHHLNALSPTLMIIACYKLSTASNIPEFINAFNLFMAFSLTVFISFSTLAVILNVKKIINKRCAAKIIIFTGAVLLACSSFANNPVAGDKPIIKPALFEQSRQLLAANAAVNSPWGEISSYLPTAAGWSLIAWLIIVVIVINAGYIFMLKRSRATGKLNLLKLSLIFVLLLSILIIGLTRLTDFSPTWHTLEIDVINHAGQLNSWKYAETLVTTSQPFSLPDNESYYRYMPNKKTVLLKSDHLAIPPFSNVTVGQLHNKTINKESMVWNKIIIAPDEQTLQLNPTDNDLNRPTGGSIFVRKRNGQLCIATVKPGSFENIKLSNKLETNAQLNTLYNFAITKLAASEPMLILVDNSTELNNFIISVYPLHLTRNLQPNGWLIPEVIEQKTITDAKQPTKKLFPVTLNNASRVVEYHLNIADNPEGTLLNIDEILLEGTYSWLWPKTSTQLPTVLIEYRFTNEHKWHKLTTLRVKKIASMSSAEISDQLEEINYYNQRPVNRISKLVNNLNTTVNLNQSTGIKLRITHKNGVGILIKNLNLNLKYRVKNHD
jgi:hypothetical protein